MRVIDIFRKYVQDVPMKDKEGITITDAFRNILDESNRKSNKMQMNKGSKLINERSVK